MGAAMEFSNFPSTLSMVMFLLNLLLGGGAVVAFIKIWPKLKEIDAGREKTKMEAEERSEQTLLDRVRSLEKKLEISGAHHEAEKSLLRHELGNVSQCLNSLLLLLKAAPGDVDKHVKVIEEMRDRLDANLAAEKGAMRAAIINDVSRLSVASEEKK